MDEMECPFLYSCFNLRLAQNYTMFEQRIWKEVEKSCIKTLIIIDKEKHKGNHEKTKNTCVFIQIYLVLSYSKHSQVVFYVL